MGNHLADAAATIAVTRALPPGGIMQWHEQEAKRAMAILRRVAYIETLGWEHLQDKATEPRLAPLQTRVPDLSFPVS